jgi:plasmid stability protein
LAAVTIRNLSDEAHRALKVRAAKHNRSAEAEMRAILEEAVAPGDRLRLGSSITALFQKAGLTQAEADALEAVRDRTPAEPVRFE